MPFTGESRWDTADFWGRLRSGVVEDAARLGATAMQGEWPDAARNMFHYLANSGRTFEQPVDTILAEVPTFAGHVESTRTDAIRAAVDEARVAGVTTPVMFPVNTEWRGSWASPGESANWFYASGSFDYNVNGTIWVYPPTTPDGEWTYRLEDTVNFRDRYNWDGGKSVEIGPMTVTDEQLQELHRAGVAQEYTMVGESSRTVTEGSLP